MGGGGGAAGGGCESETAATEGGGRAIRRAADESGHYNGLAVFEDRDHDSGCLFARAFPVGTGRAVARVGADDTVGEDRFGPFAVRAQGGGHDQAHNFFTGGDVAVGEPVGDLARQRHIRQVQFQSGMQIGDAIGGFGAIGPNGQAVEDRLVFGNDGSHGDGHTAAVASGGLATGFQKQIGDPRSRRNDNRAWSRLGGGNAGRFPNPFERSNRGASEFEYDHARRS